MLLERRNVYQHENASSLGFRLAKVPGAVIIIRRERSPAAARGEESAIRYSCPRASVINSGIDYSPRDRFSGRRATTPCIVFLQPIVWSAVRH